MVEPGRTRLGDRYELGGLIAAGGMGQVWRGTDVLLGRPVAVKVLRSEYTGDPTFLARFRAEAQNAAALSHPNIACVYDYGETVAEDGSGETLAYLVMELVEGRPLNDVIRRDGRVDTETTLRILEQTAAGLAEAHRAGMVHRDVKPGNVLLTPDGDVKITDFGIAWSARSVALTKTGQVLGTPQYLSPEQAEGRQATPASDVYALGLIGYEMLTGHAAFDGENPVTIALKQVREEPEPLPDDLPTRVRSLVRRALAKDPAQRMADGAAFVAAIQAVREGRSIDPAPTTVVSPAAAPDQGAAPAGRPRRHRAPAGTTRPPVRRRRSRVAVVLLPLLGLLAGAGIAAMALQGLAGNGAPPAAEAAQQLEDGTFVLRADDYVGRSADSVAAELVALGLVVERETRQTTDAEPGTVVGIEPTGRKLSRGDIVVIAVAGAPDGAAGDGDSGGDVQEAGSSSSESAGAADPTTDAATPSEAPGSEGEETQGTGAGEPADDGSTPPEEETPTEEPEPTPTEEEPTPPASSTPPADPTTSAPAPSSSAPASTQSTAGTQSTTDTDSGASLAASSSAR